MPKISKYRKENVRREKIKAVQLYKTGLSMRDVAKILGRSHSFVQKALNQLSTEEGLTDEIQKDTMDS